MGATPHVAKAQGNNAMSWKDDLLDASFRGARFEVVRTRDHGERALVEHEYPYRTGAEIEDMGRKARRISITAVFYGPHYAAGLSALLQALEKPGKGELIHPVFGSVTVCAGPYDVTHDAEQPDHAEVTLEFVEAEPDNPFLAAGGRRATAQDAGLRVEDATARGKESSGRSFARWLESTAKGYSLAERVGVLDTLHQRLDDYDATHGALRASVSYLDFPTAYLADLDAAQHMAAGPFRPVQGFGNWQRLSQTFQGRSLTGGRGRAYPVGTSAYAGAVLTGPASGLAEPSPVVPGDEAPRPGRPAPVADLSSAQGAATAHAAAHAEVAQTALLAGEAATLLEAETETPTLTPHEVEAVVGNVRDRLQDAMDASRAVLPPHESHPVVEALRDAALAVQQLGALVLAARPPLVRYAVPWPCNLHLLAHRLYGDHRRAAELARLNPALRNPNFIAQGQELLIHAQ